MSFQHAPHVFAFPFRVNQFLHPSLMPRQQKTSKGTTKPQETRCTLCASPCMYIIIVVIITENMFDGHLVVGQAHAYMIFLSVSLSLLLC